MRTAKQCSVVWLFAENRPLLMQLFQFRSNSYLCLRSAHFPCFSATKTMLNTQNLHFWSGRATQLKSLFLKISERQIHVLSKSRAPPIQGNSGNWLN
jgi:hypothetical protein